MGGYAAFVWPSFAATAVVMIGLMVVTIVGLRRSKEQLARLEAETAAIQGKEDRDET